MRELTWSRSEGERSLLGGLLTWSPKEKHSDRLFGMHITSDRDEGQGAYARLSFVGRTLLLRLPDWAFRPYRERVYFTGLSETELRRHVTQTGRDWYWEVWPREYGFEFHTDTLHWARGVQTNSWTRGEKKTSGCWFYPWSQSHLIRNDYYDTDGNFYCHVPTIRDWDKFKKAQAIVPVRRFAFKDFDGQIIVATLRLEECETRMGEGRWKWLGRFFASRVYRSFIIDFSDEVGPEKGSWKGGTTGHAISSNDYSELHEEAFRRYCLERGKGRHSKHDAEMTFLYEVVQ